MLPILFKIGPLSISTYGVLVALAVLAGGSIAARGFRERRLDPEKAWSLVFYALIGGFVGAKIYYLLLQGGPLLSRSGFVWYGGLIGGGVAVAFAVRHLRLPLGPVADAMAPALALGHAIGHVGCFFSGDSYGLPSTLPWAVAFARGAPPSTAANLRNVFGVPIPESIADPTLLTVHPTMLYSTVVLLLVFGLLWWLRRRAKPAGWLFGLYLIMAGIERFAVEFLRAKDDRFLWGFTTAQAIAVLAMLAGAALLVLIRRSRPAQSSVPLAFPRP